MRRTKAIVLGLAVAGMAVVMPILRDAARAQAPGEFERELIAQGPGAPLPGPPDGRGPGLFPPRPPGLKPGLHFPSPEALERADLSDSQREKIDALRDKVRRASIRLEADIRIAEMDVEELIVTDDVASADLDDAIARLEEARTALLRTHAKAIVQMRAMLSPQQRAKLKRPVAPRWH